MTLRHLESNHINTIALSLDEDVYGANGELDDIAIKQRLIENIHDWTNYAYVETDRMPIWHVADLIRSIWEHMDRHITEEIADVDNFRRELCGAS